VSYIFNASTAMGALPMPISGTPLANWVHPGA